MKLFRFLTTTLIITSIFGSFGFSVHAQTNSGYGVFIVWSGNTVYPPFSKNKPSLSRGSDMVAHALLYEVSTGNVVSDINNFTYVWKFNNQVLGNKSGVGKNTFTLDSTLQNFDISVEVRNGNSVIATDFADISFGIPEILLYEYDSLSGVDFSRLLNNRLSSADPEITVRAFPYNFSSSNIEYSWKRGNETIGGGVNQSEITFGGSGQEVEVALSVQASDLLNRLQSAFAKFRLQ